MKKISMTLVIVLVVLFIGIISCVQAAEPLIRRNTVKEIIGNGTGVISSNPGQLRKEAKKLGEFEKSGPIGATGSHDRIEGRSGPTGATGLFNRIKDYIKKNFKFGARIEGTILSIGTGSLSEKGNDGKTYQVNITSTTNLLRKFGGKSSLTEFSVGDRVMVFGKFTDTAQTTIDANIIRNLSIQKRRGTFFGKVTLLNSDNFVMQTVERGVQTVYFGTAKFIDRKGTGIIYSDVKVGDRVRVKGVWDKTLSKISEVTEVKDFSLPVIVSPTPTQTQTPTPTPTGTI